MTLRNSFEGRAALFCASLAVASVVLTIHPISVIAVGLPPAETIATVPASTETPAVPVAAAQQDETLPVAAAPVVVALASPTQAAPVFTDPVMEVIAQPQIPQEAIVEETAVQESIAQQSADNEPTEHEATGESSFVLASIDPSEMIAPEVAEPEPSVVTPDPANSVAVLDECPSATICIDRYLWTLYERAPKVDAHRVYEKRKVTVTNKKGKKRTVTRTFSKIVDEDFTWKDPKAAERANMAMAEYVIGGMDPAFKLKLFRALHAAAEAGLQPGITSAFRDDYRQSIATGMKAASDKSFHGGSSRGGYGKGAAADIVSVKGATRAQRWVSTDRLWKWIDENGPQFGIARPYLNRDPPHVGPVDGKEYAMTAHRRPAPKTQDAEAATPKSAKMSVPLPKPSPVRTASAG